MLFTDGLKPIYLKFNHTIVGTSREYIKFFIIQFKTINEWMRFFFLKKNYLFGKIKHREKSLEKRRNLEWQAVWPVRNFDIKEEDDLGRKIRRDWFENFGRETSDMKEWRSMIFFLRLFNPLIDRKSNWKKY